MKQEIGFDICCFQCEHYNPQVDAPRRVGHVVGICDVVENIGEFNNAIYYGNSFVPCSGIKYSHYKNIPLTSSHL